MFKNILKILLAASPCILLLFAVASSVRKPVEAKEAETVSEYDFSQIEDLVKDLKKETEETTTQKKTETETQTERKTKQASAQKADYQDGTYYGTGTGFAGKIKVCVVVRDKKIQSVEVTEIEKDDAAFVERAKGVIEQVLSTQSLEVDAVSGATYSSRGILEAIKNALTGETSTSTAAAAAPAAAQTSTAPAAVTKREEPASGYRDGTYTGTGAGFGGQVKVKLQIKNGKIKSIEVTQADGEGSTYLESAKSLIPKIIKKQSPDVDAVSGATYTSNGILNAVWDALEQAERNTSDKNTKKNKTKKKKKNQKKKDEKEKENAKTPDTDPPEPEPFVKPSAYRDGTYTAKSQGFRGEMTVTVVIQEGKITDIQVTGKDDDPYFSNAKQLISRILNAQDVTGIDGVSGATYSSNGILNGVKLALKQAAVSQESEGQTESETEKETEPATETEPAAPSCLYQDGSYVGTARGYIYDISATVVISGGRIASITAESLEDPEQEEWLLMVKDTIINQVLKNQSAEQVDGVTGATYSSQGLQKAIEQALEQAKKEEQAS